MVSRPMANYPIRHDTIASGSKLITATSSPQLVFNESDGFTQLLVTVQGSAARTNMVAISNDSTFTSVSNAVWCMEGTTEVNIDGGSIYILDVSGGPLCGITALR